MLLVMSNERKKMKREELTNKKRKQKQKEVYILSELRRVREMAFVVDESTSSA